MDRLTTTQIGEFNNADAFALSRQKARLPFVRLSAEDPDGKKTVKTPDFQGTNAILGGLQDRFARITENLSTMLDIAQDAAGGRLSDLKQAEAFGKLRSLSAGIDQLVESTRFRGQNLLNGQTIELRDGVSATSKSTIELANLKTFGEDSLGLAKKEAGAQTTIFFKPATISFNSTRDLIGIDLSEANSVDVQVGNTELETGDYEAEIIYEGKNSTIILRDINGVVRTRKEGVDLSGTGQEIIDMGVGLQLSIEKENILGGEIDKFPFETLGPESLKLDIEYRRNFRHVLTSGNEDEITKTSVDLKNSFRTVDGDSSLAFTNINLVPKNPGFRELETGTYNVRVRYNGENSTVELRDNTNGLVGLQVLDLSETGTTSINLGVGVQVDLQNLDFDKNGSIATAQFSYEQSENNAEDFDYKRYAQSIEEALFTMETQQLIVQSAIDTIQAKQQSQAQGSEQALANLQNSVLGGGSLVNLLSSQLSGTAAKIFGVNQATAQLQASTDGLFASANSLISAQADLRFASTVSRVGSEILA